MNKVNLMNAAIAGVLAMGVVGSGTAIAAEKVAMEKCTGIAKAGKNDRYEQAFVWAKPLKMAMPKNGLKCLLAPAKKLLAEKLKPQNKRCSRSPQGLRDKQESKQSVYGELCLSPVFYAGYHSAWKPCHERSFS